MDPFPEGLIAVVKKECPTCSLIEPVFGEIAASEFPFTVYTQDEPSFPTGLANVVDDTDLERSYHLNVEAVPTLIRVENGSEVERTVGWHREEWEAFTGLSKLGEGLPGFRPG